MNRAEDQFIKPGGTAEDCITSFCPCRNCRDRGFFYCRCTPNFISGIRAIRSGAGLLPAPESAHAIYGAVQEALKCKESGEAKTILFGLTGTGYFDMYAYQSYMDGTMKDYIPTDAELEKSFARLPKIPGIQE